MRRWIKLKTAVWRGSSWSISDLNFTRYTSRWRTIYWLKKSQRVKSQIHPEQELHLNLIYWFHKANKSHYPTSKSALRICWINKDKLLSGNSLIPTVLHPRFRNYSTRSNFQVGHCRTNKVKTKVINDIVAMMDDFLEPRAASYVIMFWKKEIWYCVFMINFIPKGILSECFL